MLKLFKLLFITFIFISAIQTANAGISLSQTIVHFEEDGKRSEDIEVFNQGDETAYIRVELSVIENPGLANEKKHLQRDPRKAGLLVTPQRLIVPAGTRKRLRFVRLDNPKTNTQDRVYRVLIKPEVGEVSSEQTAVKIIIAYEVLVLSQPKDPNFQLDYQYKDKKLILKNLGNTNVLLLQGSQCPEGQEADDEVNDCVELKGKRLYAGAKWEVGLPYTTPVTFRYSKGLENDVITFDLTKTNNKK